MGAAFEIMLDTEVVSRRLIGIDISNAMAKKARDRVSITNSAKRMYDRVVVGDLEELIPLVSREEVALIDPLNVDNGEFFDLIIFAEVIW